MYYDRGPELGARRYADLQRFAPRPSCSALRSERAVLLPSLYDALSRYLRLEQQAAEEDYAGQAALVANS
ncbi:MAG: dTDP-4-dehydrorhamnose reductase [Herminiimonas sp.]|nr:dTDP-4-dehydrorhamnose reductase [Herminiimonas sp.]